MRSKHILRVMATMLLCLPAMGQQFSGWTAPVNLNNYPIAGAGAVNSSATEVDPYISKDGLSLYFACDTCPGSLGGFDLYVSQRASKADPWGAPQNLGPTVNSSSNEANPSLSTDEHRLFFTSSRAGGNGGVDIYVSRRHNRRDDLGWQAAENAGAGINSASNDRGPTYFEDESTGAIVLYFHSDRPGGLGGDDIYTSMLQADGTFGPAALVVELSSPRNDQQPAIRKDGLEIFFASNRLGGTGGGGGGIDLWTSTRSSTSDPWSTPVNVGPLVNTLTHEGSPAIAFDGTALYFMSAGRADGTGPLLDLYVTTREKLKDAE
jgi:Tol biopolymer transport system component